MISNPAPLLDSFADRAFQKSLRIQHPGLTLEIRRRWLGLQAFASFIAALLISIFPLSALSIQDTVWRIFTAFVTAIALHQIYFAVASLLNTSTLRLTPESLELQNSPLPWPGNLSLPTSDIAGILTIPKTRFAYNPRHQHTTYRLQLTTKSGAIKYLFRPFSKREHAETVRTLIAAHLQRVC